MLTRTPPAAGFAATLLLGLLAACGRGPASPPGIQYRLPSPSTVTYASGDTLIMDVDADGQILRATIGTASRLGASFERGLEGGVRVTLTVQDFQGRFDNPAGPGSSADGSHISGPLVLSLDRKGAVTVESQPEVTGTARQFFDGLSTAHSLFPRLPGRSVKTGDTWTDTIRYEGKQGDGHVSSRTVVTYTVVGDTVVAGRPTVNIHFQGDLQRDVSGIIAGMDYSRRIDGTLSGWVAWDQGRSLMVESLTEVEGEGSIDVSEASYPLGLRVHEKTSVRLQNNM